MVPEDFASSRQLRNHLLLFRANLGGFGRFVKVDWQDSLSLPVDRGSSRGVAAFVLDGGKAIAV